MWEPWKKYKDKRPDTDNSIPITEPPCKNCEYWGPTALYRQDPPYLIFDGIQCCHIPTDQEQDFSCFSQLTE